MGNSGERRPGAALTPRSLPIAGVADTTRGAGHAGGATPDRRTRGAGHAGRAAPDTQDARRRTRRTRGAGHAGRAAPDRRSRGAGPREARVR
ncbi:hypothetical protein FRIGORI9N_110022 [Frigoribacterium sp. 9N]|nr:hypothetical protein FRIGORI9N_110022 [Frigoribacterium sp. 9N]